MNFRWNKKMILSSLLLVLIFIRHAVGTYQEDHLQRYPFKPQHHHKSFPQHSRIEEHKFSLPHPHRHHHDNMHKSNREMQIEPHHSRLNYDRDHRKGQQFTKKTTASTIRPPTTLSWKWSSEIAYNQKLAELTHIKYRKSGNETSVGSPSSLKNRHNDGKRQQWEMNNKQIFIGPFRRKTNSDTPTTTMKTYPDPVVKSSWFHYSHPLQQIEDRRLRDEEKHRTFVGKASRIVDVDLGKISHEDQKFKSITDSSEDDDYYYGEDDENDGLEAESNIKITKDRQEVENDNKYDITKIDKGNYNRLIDKASTVDRNKISQENQMSIRKGITDSNKDDEDYYGKYDEHNWAMAEDIDQHEAEVDDNYGYLNDQPPLQTGNITEMKWNTLSTQEGVKRARNDYFSDRFAATEHQKRVFNEAKCRWPHPTVIAVPYFSTSSFLSPRCTIMHRCGDNTACCQNVGETCVAKSNTTVDLFFWVLSPLNPDENGTIISRTFVNHTECHCVKSNSLSSTNRHRRTIKHNLAAASTTSFPNESCHCTSHFDIIQDRKKCRCDCLRHNRACHVLKKGQDRFPYEDQKCILEGSCQVPKCEHGLYSTQSGRCPSETAA